MRVIAIMDMELYEDGRGLEAGDIVETVKTFNTLYKDQMAIQTGSLTTDTHHFSKDMFYKCFKELGN